MRAKKIKSDIETLKTWCHWRRRDKNLSDDDRDFVKSIEDVISQVGSWQRKACRVLDERDLAYETLADLSLRSAEKINELTEQRHQLNASLVTYKYEANGHISELKGQVSQLTAELRASSELRKMDAKSFTAWLEGRDRLAECLTRLTTLATRAIGMIPEHMKATYVEALKDWLCRWLYKRGLHRKVSMPHQINCGCCKHCGAIFKMRVSEPFEYDSRRSSPK